MNKKMKYNQLKPLQILMITLLIQSSILPNFVSIVSAEEYSSKSIEGQSSSETKDSLVEDTTNNTENRTTEKDTISNIQPDTKAKDSLSGNQNIKNDSQTETTKESQDKETKVDSGIFGTCSWNIDSSGTLHIGQGTLEISGLGTGYDDGHRPPWMNERERINEISFDGRVTANTSTAFLFQSLRNVKQIKGLELLDTSKTSNMRWMFNGLSNLKTLDLSSFDTHNVTDMTNIFSGMSNLESLDLSYCSTASATNLTGMFSGLSSLKTLNLKSFDTRKVTSMNGMFNGLSSLETLNLGDFFDPGQVTNQEELLTLFTSLVSLKSLNLGRHFNTAHMTSMKGMFNGLSNLESLDFGLSFVTYDVTDMESMFKDMSSLKKLELPPNFDTRKVTNMGGMFQGMSNLESIDSTYFETSSVINMSHMFYNSNIPFNLDLSSFDTSNVTSMKKMFQGATLPTDVNLSKWDTSNVIDVSNMFCNVKGVENLNLSSFNTGNVIYMGSMLWGANSLRTLDISNFDTSKVTDMKVMFKGTSNLSQLSLGKKFNFGKNAGLEDIEVLGTSGKWRNIGTGTAEEPTGEKLWSSSEFMENYNGPTDADTYVWQWKDIEVKPQNGKTVLGRNSSLIDPSNLIESVTFGGDVLSKDEYSVDFLSDIDTSSLGKKEVKLRVSIVGYEGFYEDTSATLDVQWGSTLVVEDNGQKAVDASVSLIDNNGSPSLNANQGFGTLNPLLTSRPDFNVFRGDTTQKVLNPGVGVITESPQELSKRWNDSFASTSLKYGDVAVITVDNWGGSENWHGEDTFISRNEKLVKETEGYDDAYYELTKEGYRLLHLNQFTVNNDKHVSLGTTKEEMNKNISDYIILPTTIDNPEDYRMEFINVDTASSGKKTSIMNVYEKLESGGEFLTTYEVSYVVDPVVTEDCYDIDNNLLSSDKTEFEYGTSFEPSPTTHKEVDGILYIYKGWSDEKPGTENTQVQEGVPGSTTKEKTYYYIYEKADKFINVTLPTEVIFGTYEDPKAITSKDYTIKNNSNVVDLEIDLASFDKVKSDVKLLDKEDPVPTEKEASARLDLIMNDQSVLPGLTETTSEQKLGYVSRGQSSNLGISGIYFGEKSDNHKVEYAMHLKFKASVDGEK